MGILRTGLALTAAAALCAAGCGRRATPPPPAPSAVLAEPDSLRRLTFPTDRQAADDWDAPDTFQPTASGRPESALFGSIRSQWVGRRLRPSFHEGMDIAPQARDARGWALDSVRAAADGTVAYVNRAGGNSNYGKYIVLAHPSTIGELYTLSAHLAEIAPGLRAGQPVRAGEVLGRMGHTSSALIPPARAHLHFEIALMANARFDRWYRARKLKPDHGNFHGHNLIGMDPLAVYRGQQEDPDFTFLEHLAAIPRAFELVLATARLPDFFRRYPRLWAGAPFSGRGVVLAASENGLPLGGWNAGDAELAELGKQPWRVRKVDADILGRNGCRLVVRRDGNWTLGPAGERWLEILAYP